MRLLLAALVILPGAVASLAEAASFELKARLEAARPGDTLLVPAGVHPGPFVIGKSLRLVGAPGAILEGTGQGHVVNITAPDVEISGFVIRHSGSNLSTDDAGIHVSGDRAVLRANTIVDTLHGIYLRQAGDCRISDNVIRGRSGPASVEDPLTKGLKLSPQEMCSSELEQNQRGNGIHVWNCSRHQISGNDIRGTRDGIYFSFCDDTEVVGNTIENVRYGLHYMYSDNNRFERNTFRQNAAGSALMYSSGITLKGNVFSANRSHRAYGLLMHSVEQTLIEENRFEGNTVGVYLENCVYNRVLNNSVRANYIGLRVAESSNDNVFSENAIALNIHAVETTNQSELNHWSRERRGNGWEDAIRLDLNRDGVADVPHLETDLFGRWRRQFPEIGLLSSSPGERAVRFIHSRVRVPSVPGVRDNHPLMAQGTP